MATALDVAAYILGKQGPLAAMKLQKLVYYCQAWSLVWDEKPLFQNKIEAWANGPVIRDLYEAHRGQFEVRRIAGGSPGALSQPEVDTVDAVLKFPPEGGSAPKPPRFCAFAPGFLDRETSELRSPPRNPGP